MKVVHNGAEIGDLEVLRFDYNVRGTKVMVKARIEGDKLILESDNHENWVQPLIEQLAAKRLFGVVRLEGHY